MLVERIGRAIEVVAHPGETGRAGVPVGNAVRGNLLDVEVGDCARDLEEALANLGDAVRGTIGCGDLLVRETVDPLQLLRVSGEDPRETARPRREGRVPLLRGRAAVRAGAHVEDALVHDATADVVAVADLSRAIRTEIDVVPRGRLGVLQEPTEQRDPLVLLAHENVPELMAERERAHAADRVREEAVRAVEAAHVADVARELDPATRLHRPRELERELIVLALPGVLGDRAFAHHAEEVPVRAHVVEAVVVHTNVRDVRRHPAHRLGAPVLEQLLVAGRLEEQERAAVLKSLRPLGPASARVPPGPREDRRSLRRIPPFSQQRDRLPCDAPQVVQALPQVVRPQRIVCRNHRVLLLV